MHGNTVTLMHHCRLAELLQTHSTRRVSAKIRPRRKNPVQTLFFLSAVTHAPRTAVSVQSDTLHLNTAHRTILKGIPLFYPPPPQLLSKVTL